jgi:hypothetical protein
LNIDHSGDGSAQKFLNLQYLPVEVHGDRLWLGFSTEREQTLYQVASVLRGMEYLLEVGILRVIPILLGQQQLRISQDNLKQVIEVMGDASGKSAYRLHLLGLKQLLL